MLNQLYTFIKKFKPGHLYTIAARPAMGKTTVARRLAAGLYESGEKVLYISTEIMSEKKRKKRACDSYDFLYRPLITTEDIRNVAYIGRYNVIIVDSLQYMYKKSGTDNAYALRRIAEELNLSVIVLSSVSRKADWRKGHMPLCCDLTKRLCGQLYCASDAVIFLFRDAYYLMHSENHDITFLIHNMTDSCYGSFKTDFNELLNIWKDDIYE